MTMPQPILSRDQVRSIDQRAIRDYRMSGLVLMENAGRGTAELLAGLGIQGQVVICCGRGNNAGDGLVIARHLDLMGHDTHTVMLAPPDELRGDAAANYHVHHLAGLTTTVLDADRAPHQLGQLVAQGDWVVDAILGTGARGGPRPPWDSYVRIVNDCEARKLAVDVPTGLDCDTGAVSNPTFRADHTATFVAIKPGLIKAPSIVGKLHVVGIGVPRKLVAEVAASGTVPPPNG